jgi:hypothetical protein
MIYLKSSLNDDGGERKHAQVRGMTAFWLRAAGIILPPSSFILAVRGNRG